MTKIKKPVKPTPVSKPEGPGPFPNEVTLFEKLIIWAIFTLLIFCFTTLVVIMGFVR